MAQRAVSLAPDSEVPWLILAVLASPKESVEYIHKALQINPESKQAQQALEWALSRLRTQPATREVELPSGQVRPLTEPASLADTQPVAATPFSPLKERKRLSLSPGRIRLYTLAGLAALALIAGLIFLRPLLVRMLAGSSSQGSCSLSLVLGTRAFAVETHKTRPDGTWDVPRGEPERAYWVEGTLNNSLFVLNPVRDNLDLVVAVKSGDTATVTRANCNTTSYSLSPAAAGVQSNPALLDQTRTQITIFIPVDNVSAGLVLQGQLLGEQLTTFNTPDVANLQAEISLLATTPSLDGTTFTVDVSINNYGQTALRLTSGDIWLTPEGASPLSPIRSTSSLPISIKPGTTETISITFARPAALAATLKIYTVEFTLEGY